MKRKVAEAIIETAPTAIPDEAISDEDAIMEGLTEELGEETVSESAKEETIDAEDAAELASLGGDEE